MLKLHNLSTVLRFEYVRTINKPSFWIATLALPVILLIVVGLLVISNRSSEQADQRVRDELKNVQVIDRTDVITDEALGTVQATESTDETAALQAVRDGESKVLIVYPADLTKDPVKIFVDAEESSTTSGAYEQLARQLLSQSAASTLDNKVQVAALTGEYSVSTTTYSDGEESNLILKAIVPGIFLVLFYILVILLGNQMLTSTTEEKENRTVEMVLTTLRPRVLILGKMLAIICAGLTQVAAVLIPVIIVYFFFRDNLSGAIPNFDISMLIFDPLRIFFAVCYFAVGFLIFTSINVIAGSLAPSAKEAGAFYGVSIFSMFVPFYALTSLISAPDALITKIFTFFPLTQPVTLLIRNAIGNLGVFEQWIALGIMVVSAVLGIALAVRAFRFGALEYSRKIKFSELLPNRKS